MEVPARITRSYILLTLACALAGSANAQFIQQGGKLAAAAPGADQGSSVVLSADGNTAIVGGTNDNNGAGAAWVYTCSGGVWTQQGGKLAGTGAVGSARQGGSVALSSDGNTAIVGGAGDNAGVGAAWVFTRSGGVWTQQGSKLAGSGATPGITQQGTSVSLSGDGNTAIMGGPGDNSGAGAAWVYTRSGGVWTQQGSKLVGAGTSVIGIVAVGASQGSSVALSSDGNTAIVGGPFDGSGVGAAWVYTRSGGVWTQQGSKLAGTGAVRGVVGYGAHQGSSVALSADGNTAIVGGPADNNSGFVETGAAWVFTRSGGVWTQQGSKLVGTGAVGQGFQGISVALSGDGNMAIVGGSGDNNDAGAAWVYTRSGAVWTQQASKLTGIGAVGSAGQGGSVALSGDANTAIVGGPGDNSGAGAAWVFVAHSSAPVGLAALPASLAFTSQVNGWTPPSQSLIVTSTTGASESFLYAAVTTTGPSGWLSMAPASAVTPAIVVVQVNPMGLSAGVTYTGYLAFVPVQGTGTLQVPVQYTVTETPQLSSSPSSLLFYSTVGLAPAVQTLSVSSTITSVVFAAVGTTNTGGSWLSVTPSSGTTPGTLSVRVNGATLTAGTYFGTITVTANSAEASPLMIPVALTVATAPTITVAPTSLQFSWQAGSGNPSPAMVNVSGGGQSLGFAAQITGGSNWLSVSPTNGTTPTTGSATLTVTATPGNLGPGSYNGTILVSATGAATGSTSITVALTVTAPPPSIKGVTNAASYAIGAVSPGELVTIFGTAIGPATAAGATTDPATGKLATTIGGVQVLFNGTAVPMIYASSTQVSAVVPYEMSSVASPSVWIKYAGQASNAYQLTTTTTVPGLFTQSASGSGPGSILNQDNSVNGPGNRAAKGSIVQVFMTGEGQTSPPSVTGAITAATLPPPQVTPAPLLVVGVLVNGLPALYVYAGEAPGLVAGMMQLNVQIPSNAPSGDLAILVSIGGHTSQNGVTVSVQ